ncbi:MAG: hypothetical protein V1788_00910 [Nanoarchaeota archaeon]|nr:hypothetical protein [Nanoarchaeota archaeon]
MRKHKAQNVENHPTYEEMDLNINSDEELNESLNYVRENVNIETEEELVEAKKLARVTDPISSLVRAREYGLKYGDSKLVKNAEERLEKSLGKLPNRQVIFSGGFEAGSDTLLRDLEKYDSQRGNSKEKEPIYLVLDKSIESHSSSGHWLSHFGVGIVGGLSMKDRNPKTGKFDDNMITMRRTLDERINELSGEYYPERKSKLAQDFWRDVKSKITEEDIHKYPSGKSEYVGLKEGRGMSFLKDFLERRGYELKIIDSYDKLPLALDSYVHIGGSIGWAPDERRILEKITAFDIGKLEQKN